MHTSIAVVKAFGGRKLSVSCEISASGTHAASDVNRALRLAASTSSFPHSACQLSIFDQRRSDVANSEDKVYG